MSNDAPTSPPDGFPQGRATDMQDILLSPPTGEKPATATTGPWQPPSAEELQKLLPQYEITALLGRGGMGAVYKGTQIALDRPVAIKILSNTLEDADASFAERFKNEARAMAKLSHPGIVGVYDFGETAGGLLYIVMEFIEGTDVAKMISQQKRLHTGHAMAITAHVCDALAYAHERGIIHRDIKPANIMVGYDGVVKVADFGLAKMTHSQNSGLTQSGMAMGTLHYMAPEALMLGAGVDHRADIYAVGVMLYQMLTGKLPQGMFELPSLQVPGLDPRYDGIIAKALRDDRELRYQSAAEMRFDLDHILTQPVIKVEPDATQAPAALPTEARPQRTAGQPYRPPHPQVVMKVQKKSSPLLWLTLVCLSALCVWLLKHDPVLQKAPPAEQPTSSSDASATAPVQNNAAGSTPAPVDSPAASKAAMIAPNGSSSVVWNGRWKFTEKLPAEGWFASDFDDGQWKEGDSPFGVAEPDESRTIPSRWDTPYLWLRRTFDLPPNVPLERVAIRLWYDSDGDVYLNGVPAFKFAGYNCQHSNIPLGEAAFKALRHGRNTIAIHGHNSGGGQVLDLTIQIDEFAKRPLLASEVTPEQLQAGLFVGRLQRTNADVFTGNFDVNHYPMWPNDMKKYDVRVLLAGKPCNYLYTHAPTGVLYELPPLARRFTATGIAATSTHPGINGRAWAYKVTIDRQTVFTSKPLNEYPNGEVSIDVPIPEGAKLLALTTDTLGSNFCDHAIWANPRLYAAAANAEPSPVADPVIPSPQTWTDIKGRSIMATFKAIANGNVLLEIAGKVTPVAMNTLSTASQKQARDHQQQTQPAASAASKATKDQPFVNSLGMKYVPVPGTKVLMCVHETRRQDYRIFASERSDLDTNWQNQVWQGHSVGASDDHPVTGVSWDDAKAFCAWLSTREGITYRLPTDREWSAAVGIADREPEGKTPFELRDGVPGVWPWGNVFPPQTPMENLADLTLHDKIRNASYLPGYTDGFVTTAPVMSFPPNSLGIHDLGGNVAEWVEDLFSDPGQSPTARTLRLGSFIVASSNWSLASHRSSREPRATYLPDIGFRVVLEMTTASSGLSVPSPTKTNLASVSVNPATATPPSTATKDNPFVNSLGMKFVPVPGTKVLFCIHETRRSDFEKYASENPGSQSRWLTARWKNIPSGQEDNHPVVSVTLPDVLGFCAWLSKKESLPYRLATDEEWSMAVGIGHKEKREKSSTPEALDHQRVLDFPWGGTFPPSSVEIPENYQDVTFNEKIPDTPFLPGYSDGFVTTAPVMSFKPNALGIYDMGGNVREWVSDWWNEERKDGLFRGGSFTVSSPNALLSSERKRNAPTDLGWSEDRGFRIVLAVPTL